MAEPEEWIVVNGVIKAGISNQDIYLSYTSQGNNEMEPVIGADVRLSGSNEIALVGDVAVPGHYYNPSADIVMANQQYELLINHQGKEVSAITRVPKQLIIEQVSAQTIPIDPNSTGQPIFSVLWEDNEEYSYVLMLKNLEASPEEIPFSVPSGQFEEIYNAPIPAQGATLYDTDFKYYGNHILTIYAINKEYEEVFFYQLDYGVTQISTGPENIVNGSGFFSGVSFVEISLNLLEM